MFISRFVFIRVRTAAGDTTHPILIALVTHPAAPRSGGRSKLRGSRLMAAAR
jgi:hypothetical protein